MLGAESPAQLLSCCAWPGQHLAQDGEISGITQKVSSTGEVGSKVLQVLSCLLSDLCRGEFPFWNKKGPLSLRAP